MVPALIVSTMVSVDLFLLVYCSNSNSNYAGTAANNCDVSNIGLWVDALNFVVLTMQMILFDTQYTTLIKNDIVVRESEATM